MPAPPKEVPGGTPMIARFSSLKGLGVFLDYSHGADVPELLQYNLIYGFNGSGKTTLSRVLASLEAGAVHPALPVGGTFELDLTGGERVKNAANLDRLKDRVLVFNVDFVERSIQWKEGTVSPVFYIGKEQADTAKKVEAAQNDLKDLADERAKLQKESEKASKDFTAWKRDTARAIAENLGAARKYEAPTLVADFNQGSYGEADQLSQELVTSLLATITQQAALPPLPELALPAPGLGKLVAETRRMLETTLGELALAELKEHAQMVPWVKRGLEYHTQHQIQECLFCANPITQKRIEALQAALDNKLDQLNSDLANARATATQVRDTAVKAKALPSNNDLSPELRSEFAATAQRLIAGADSIIAAAESLVGLIGTKLAAPHTKVGHATLLTDESAQQLDGVILALVRELNSIIKRHNGYSAKFEAAKEDARKKIKRHHLARYQGSYNHHSRVTREKAEALEKASAKHADVTRQLEDLQRAVRRHGEAETRINELIQRYLGHKELKIQTLENGYQILRHGKPAPSSLSEGEKTAFALCYFLSTLDAEGRKRKNLIVVVDDPISSLDTRALHHAFGLIKSSLNGAGQMIIMTHNLHFMNEVKKWLKRKEKPDKGKTPTATFLYVEAKQDPQTGMRSASISRLPDLIRDYESEYHYLFHLAMRFLAGEDHYQYLMPNALRKLLEIFLAFKDPGPHGLEDKVKNITSDCKLDEASMIAVERLLQLESHADSLDDLIALSPMTLEETKAASTALFEMMKRSDETHFQRMSRLCRVKTASSEAAE